MRGEGERVPLSEEEQRILHEMEQKLYADDRAFVDRVRTETSRTLASRSLRWAALIFAAGFAVLLVSFRSSLLLGTFGFLVMLLATLVFERSARQVFVRAEGERAPGTRAPGTRARGLGEELTTNSRRLRSLLRRER